MGIFDKLKSTAKQAVNTAATSAFDTAISENRPNSRLKNAKETGMQVWLTVCASRLSRETRALLSNLNSSMQRFATPKNGSSRIMMFVGSNASSVSTTKTSCVVVGSSRDISQSSGIHLNVSMT